MTPEQIQKHVDTLFSSMAALCGEAGWPAVDIGCDNGTYELLVQLQGTTTHATVYVYSGGQVSQVIESATLRRDRMAVKALRTRSATEAEVSATESKDAHEHTNAYRTADVPQQGGS